MEGAILRAKNIDILKAICTFFVVCIHIKFPGTAGRCVTAVAVISVPVFFLITGYFYEQTVCRNRQGGQLKKIFVLLIFSGLIYLVWTIVFFAFKQENLLNYLSEWFSTKNLLELIFLNKPYRYEHLWYLLAILYVLIIVWGVDRLQCRKFLYWITPFLLLTGLALGKYALLLFHRKFPAVLSRNFLFEGIPYFCIGCMIKDLSLKKGSILRIVDARREKRFLFFLGLLAIASLLEGFFLSIIKMTANGDRYISTIFLSIAVFVLALSTQEREPSSSKLLNALSIIGRKYSTWIYILHPIFIDAIGEIMKGLSIYSIYGYIAPIVVYISTLLFLVALSHAKQYLVAQRA